MLRQLSFNSWIFLAILLLGAVLRLYNFSDLSLGNDELSVLARVQYDSFDELIEKGVKPDVHPAGIQVFVYYWTCIFGESEIALRFPFIVAGLISIVLLFRLGKSWCGEETALLSTAAFASLQYTITLTVYARPYALVICFVLAMTLCWHRYMFEKGGLGSLIGYIAFASLAMYFHYFSFLILGIIGLTGVFLVSAEKRKAYLIGLGAIAFLYLPHLSLFLHHLGMGGSSWIGKPEPNYILSYLDYVFHFSFVLLLITGLTFLLSLFFFLTRKNKVKNQQGLFRVLSLLFFAFPFLIGYLYSVWQAPVMHTGGLFFSFPFFLLFLFSFIPRIPKSLTSLLLILYLSVSLLSLIYERSHFKLFYDRSAEEIVKQMKLHDRQTGIGNTVYLLQLHDPYYADYYLQDSSLKVEVYDLDSLQEIAVLRSFLSNRKEDYLSLGWLSKPIPPHFIPVIREFYPHIMQRRNYFISEHYIFTKKEGDFIAPIYSTKVDFENPNTDWEPLDVFRQDSVVAEGQFSGFISEDQTFGPTLSLDLTKIDARPYREIWMRCKVKLEDPAKDLQLVLHIQNEVGEEVWRSRKISQFMTDTTSWNTMHFMSRIQHLELGKGKHKLKVYLWNPDKANAWFDELEFRIEAGNPNLYGLVEPLYD